MTDTAEVLAEVSKNKKDEIKEVAVSLEIQDSFSEAKKEKHANNKLKEKNQGLDSDNTPDLEEDKLSNSLFKLAFSR